MYSNIKELLILTEKENKSLSEIILLNEIELSERNKEEILDDMWLRYEVMVNSANKALFESADSEGNLIAGIASNHYNYIKKSESICGSLINMAMARALSCSEVNASMGKICAMPTAGSCGIVPAVIISVAEEKNKTKEEILKALLVSSGIGAVITKNATVSGAEGGCQAECGVAAAMAAAGAVELYGGTPQMAAEACGLALINVMGLICDPIGGLVQIPCAQRNASQAVNALLSADLALAGMKCRIPTDEIIEAMYRVGKKLPMELRETALGGIAATKTGKMLGNFCDKY
ncbi:L-serine ammonia-lyase, iron-sulfur-dependent, subunit alpha [Anaerovorax odorimutans]|uniref:L-serine ammonia-lyase, iron-sulfur-dependent, subunit alpha n=1 Tax=Anaerovorax odorimutans TaxID=109327 RepID=UPI000420349A|nr:L-serine ammonia-lyase, iron-sulfur-dependent, subunit alpha [Anaerovorax odorimutans]